MPPPHKGPTFATQLKKKPNSKIISILQTVSELLKINASSQSSKKSFIPSGKSQNQNKQQTHCREETQLLFGQHRIYFRLHKI